LEGCSIEYGHGEIQLAAGRREETVKRGHGDGRNGDPTTILRTYPNEICRNWRLSSGGFHRAGGAGAARKAGMVE